jgi:hypothetical protein
VRVDPIDAGSYTQRQADVRYSRRPIEMRPNWESQPAGDISSMRRWVAARVSGGALDGVEADDSALADATALAVIGLVETERSRSISGVSAKLGTVLTNAIRRAAASQRRPARCRIESDVL